jgi:hypothetical protein
MSFKNLFLKDDAQTPKKDESKTEAKVETKPVNATVVTPSTIGATGVVDNKFVEMLMQVIAQFNQDKMPGQDYFEFKQSIDAMANLPIDDTNKFLSAYAVLSGQGCTKDVLLSSLDKYIALIQGERTNFDTELENQYNAKVKAKVEAVEKAKLQLEELNKQIRETNEFVISTSQEIQQEEGNLQIVAANFNKSVQMVLNNLENDKNKINNLIK